MVGILLVVVTITTLAVQAKLKERRMVVVLSGATISTLLAVTLGNLDIKDIYDGIPWDVLVILLGLGIFSSLLAKSRLFSLLAVRTSVLSKGKYLFILIMFSSIMFILSCVLNNLTALLLILPVLLSILASLGATQKFLALCFSLLIVACNLGGAATPIGDFPAILLMGTGSISFTRYLALAFPVCFLLFAIIAIFWGMYYQKKCRIDLGKLETSFALTAMRELYRNVTVDCTILYPGIGILCTMFALWIFGNKINLGPSVVCFLGVAAFMIVKNQEAEDILRNRDERNKVDFEAILFLGALFVMVSCMAGSGILEAMAKGMSASFSNPKVLICVLMLCTGIATAIFSAGPSMATMLPVAQTVVATGNVDGDTVYVGLALSVCAGSSFLLTAATSGPLAQAMVEKSQLTTREGQTARFDFFTFLPFGVLSYAIIQAGGLILVLLRL